MDGNERFFSASITVNEHLILDVLDNHGEYVTHGTEAALSRRFYQDWDGECKRADILALFKKQDSEYLVGIEIKDWKNRVSARMCYRYLKTYRKSCQYFYFAARKFSTRVFDIHEIGYINLNKMKVIKKPEYLYPEKKYREGVVRKLKKTPPPRRHFVMHPHQKKLDSYI
jgi:hypothetical protein